MTVYATRLVNGTDSMERLRRADAMGLFPTGPGTARGGFRQDNGAQVSVNAGTMTVEVSPFTAWVDGGVSDAQAGYVFVSDATETLAVSPGHASLSRTDVVIAEVRDQVHDGSGATDARVRILQGTPGSGAPALPTNALALRNINVPAGLSAGTGGLAAGNLGTDRRTYTTALGGVLTVGSAAERDALPVQFPGMMVYRADSGAVELRMLNIGWVNVTNHGAEGTPVDQGYPYYDSSGTRSYVRGGVAVVNVNVTCTALASPGDPIFYLRPGHRPSVGSGAIFVDVSTANGPIGDPIRLHVDATGAARIQPSVSSGTVLRGSFTVPL